MKKLLSLALACLLLFSLSACGREPKEEVSDEKPVIYLYPEQETDVRVTLDLAGELTCAYPAYGDGWSVRAAPDGTLTDESGQTYRYLYWEGTSGTDYDFSTGFCVSGEDTAAFLENALTQLGLNREEANEFIIYWLPQMQDNAYNLISFQQDVYTDSAKLTVDPAPDTLLRVFMAWRSSENLSTFPRRGFPRPSARASRSSNGAAARCSDKKGAWEMKKRRWAIIAFAVIFAAAYVAMGYCIPAFRIKLEADGWTYFLASLQALAPVKLIFSTVLSFIAALAVYNSRVFRQ